MNNPHSNALRAAGERATALYIKAQAEGRDLKAVFLHEALQIKPAAEDGLWLVMLIHLFEQETVWLPQNPHAQDQDQAKPDLAY